MKVISLLLRTAVPLVFLTACSTQPRVEPQDDLVTYEDVTYLEDSQSEEQDLIENEFDDIWKRIPTLYQLDIDQVNPRIETQLRRYATHLPYLDRISDRGN